MINDNHRKTATYSMDSSALKLRLHDFLPQCSVNGPGSRAVIWVQGCSLKCPGCFNPATHSFTGGEIVPVNTLFQRITNLGSTIEGITVSGGEPLQQFAPLLALLHLICQKTTLSVLLFTGYTWEEVQKIPDAKTLLSCVDILIAGRYDQTLHIARDLSGSKNKTIHFLTGRYCIKDLQSVPQAEIIITADGDIILSGIDPVKYSDD